MSIIKSEEENGFMWAEGKRCGGVHNKGSKNDKGLETWEIRNNKCGQH